MNTMPRNGLGIAVQVRKKERIKLPFLLWVVVLSTVVAFIGGARFLGFNISGYAWAVPLSISIIVFLSRRGRLRFPLYIWVPWIAVVLGYLLLADVRAVFQRSLMLLCPLFIGMTISKYRIGEDELSSFRRLYRYMALSLYVVVAFKTGMLVTGTLPWATGLAPEVMTGALLCTLFATSYMYGRERDIVWWGALAAIPVIALTRMGMIATGLSLPLTFAPMKIFRRVIFVAIIIAVGFALFQTERLQKKNFYSGGGTLEDARMDNPNFATSGRSAIWEKMRVEIDEQPWFGHGANASEPFVSILTGGLTHPHNDWLRLLFDYGYFGTVIFGICMLMQVLHLLRTGRHSSGEKQILLFAGATSFIVFSLFMFTDNIILYAAFFGNLQFTIIGMAYAASDTASLKKNAQSIPQKRRSLYKRIKW